MWMYQIFFVFLLGSGDAHATELLVIGYQSHRVAEKKIIHSFKDLLDYFGIFSDLLQ